MSNRWLARAVAVATLVGIAATAHAQAETPLPDPGPTSPTLAAVGQADYDAAFAAMVAGDFATAGAGFDRVAAGAQDPELAAAAREMARLARELTARHVTFAVPAGPGGTLEVVPPDRDEGRATFIVWTTFYGIYAGEVLIDDLDISDYKVGTLMVTGAMGAALVGSVYGTKHRKMTGPMGDAYSIGMIEGIANAAFLVSPVGLTDSSEQVQTTLLLAGAAGATAGLIYGDRVNPTRGQVSFASTVSGLGLATVGLGFGLVQPGDLSGHTALVLMAGGLDAGLAAGLYFGRDLDWSTSRARLVQLGSIVGGLTGLAAAALIAGGSFSGDTNLRIVTGSVLAGAWGGFALGQRFTRGMKVDRRYRAGGTSTVLAPTPLRGGAGLTLSGSF